MGRRVPKTAVKIGKVLIALRKDAGLSLSDIARHLGISYQQVQKYERGENRLPLEKLHSLKEFYGVPYEMFFNSLSHEEMKFENVDRETVYAHKFSAIKDYRRRDQALRIMKILLEE